MNKLEKWISKLNKQQKNIIGIVIPIVFLIITIKIADNVAQVYGYWSGQPFIFEVTWWVYLIYFAIVGIIEFKLFEQKNND